MASQSPSDLPLERFIPPLNEGERRVAEWLLDALEDEWTVYIQPRLHMAQPDFVCVNPVAGVVVIEVKDWSPGIYRHSGKQIEVETGAEGWTRTKQDPRKQAQDYRDIIWNDFIRTTELDDWKMKNRVKFLLVFPRMARMDAFKLTQVEVLKDETAAQIKGWRPDSTAELNSMKTVHGSDFAKTLKAVFPVTDQNLAGNGGWALGMRKLKFHLGDPDEQRERRGPIQLSRGASNIARNPNDAEVRRIRGAPGSGKSLGLASRAAILTLSGKSVLLVAHNITMANYLADITSWARNSQLEKEAAGPDIAQQKSLAKWSLTCVHFFGFLTAVVEPPKKDQDETNSEVRLEKFFDEWVQAAISTYELNGQGPYGEQLPKFDAILVDEGQDFKEAWWHLLFAHVRKPGGEIAIVCDRGQALYTQPTWLNKRREFGQWTNLKDSYRLPKDVLRPISQVLAEIHRESAEALEDFIPPELPDERQAALWTPSIIDWQNIDGPEPRAGLDHWLQEVVNSVIQDSTPGSSLSAPDIVVMTDTHELGVVLVEAAMSVVGTQFQSVFDTDYQKRQERKHSFWPGAGGFRFCTVHSFKGWESRVVVYLATGGSTLKQLYVALTRLRGEPGGVPARLYVRNFNRNFDRFKDMIMVDR